MALSVVYLLFFSCRLIFYSDAIFNIRQWRSAVVEPTDPRAFLGNDLQMICTLKNETNSKNFTSVYFEKDGTIVPSQLTDPTKPLSSRLLQLTNVQFKDEGSYYCYVNRTVGTSLRVASQRLRVYHHVKRVEKIDCLVYNWESMTCRWHLGIEYNHPINVEVTLIWNINNYSGHAFDCPHMRTTSCEWKRDGGPDSFKPDMEYWMVVNVTNTAMNEIKTSNMTIIETRLLVKPVQVTDVNVTSLNSSCLHVSWENNLPTRTKNCSIRRQSKWDNMTLYIKTTEDMIQTAAACDLVPYAKYCIAISCRPETGGFWSDERNVTHIMPENVPAAAPQTALGSFLEEACEPPSDGNCRRVTVYWKPVEERLRNGKIIAYQMRVLGEYAYNLPEMKHNTGTVALLGDKDYEIRVRAETNVGISAEYSTVKILSLQRKLHPPQDFLVRARDNGTRPLQFDLQWEQVAASEDNPSWYTIYYCRGSRSTMSCKGDAASVDGDLQWIRLPADVTNYTMTLAEGLGAEAMDSYLFGISADTDSSSSGLVWSTCTYIRDKKPSYPPKFRIAERNSDLSLTFLWEHYPCHESDLVRLYRLEYCRVSESICIGPVRSVDVKGNVASYILRDLKPQVKYGVSIQAIFDGDVGPKSAPTYGTPVTDGFLTSSFLTGIVITGFILLCLAAFGCIVYLSQWVKPSPPPEITDTPLLPDLNPTGSYWDGRDYQDVAPPPTTATSLLAIGQSTGISSSSDVLNKKDETDQIRIQERLNKNGSIPNVAVKLQNKTPTGVDDKGRITEGYSRYGVKTKDSFRALDMIDNDNVLPNSLASSRINPTKDDITLLKKDYTPSPVYQSEYQLMPLRRPARINNNSNNSNNAYRDIPNGYGFGPGHGTRSYSENSLPLDSYIQCAGDGANLGGSSMFTACSGDHRHPLPESETSRTGQEDPLLDSYIQHVPLDTDPIVHLLWQSVS